MPTIEAIKAAVAAYFDLPPIEMVSHRQGRAVAQPRQIAMTLAHELTVHSYASIGRHFGNRDHTTVIHAVKTVRRLCDEDARFANAVGELRRRLSAAIAA